MGDRRTFWLSNVNILYVYVRICNMNTHIQYDYEYAYQVWLKILISTADDYYI